MFGTRLSGLDGLRAICALFLLWGHIAQHDFCNWRLLSIPVPECCAYVFFVISGFLAGFRMDSISSICHYYKKKARRILPLYYSYLILSVLAYICLGKTTEVINTKLLYYMLLLPNIPFSNQAGILPLVHLWFIGTLVFFYLLFPLFARLKDRTPLVSFLIIIFWFALKLIARFFLGKDSFVYRFVGVTSFDILFLGVLSGIALKNGSRITTAIKKSIISKPLSITAWLLFLLSGLYGSLIPAFVRSEYIAVLALLIILTQQCPKPLPRLDCTLFKWLGNISYEIYVVQILVIILLSEGYTALHLNLSGILIYLICTLIVIGVAWVYHQWLQRFSAQKRTVSNA